MTGTLSLIRLARPRTKLLVLLFLALAALFLAVSIVHPEFLGMAQTAQDHAVLAAGSNVRYHS
jgi:hypothetical protein